VSGAIEQFGSIPEAIATVGERRATNP